MTHLRTRHKQGFALITSLIMLIVLFAVLTTYTFLTTVETRTSDASVDSATGFYAAESGYNLRARGITNTFADYRRPEGTPPTSDPPCLEGDQGAGAFACVSYELNDRTIYTYIQPSPTNGEEGRPSTVSRQPYTGLNSVEFGYDFFSDAYPPNEIRPEARIQTRTNVQLVPLFQFAVFYDKDLEIHPGPQMTLNGRVHVNGNLYLTSGSGLDITGQISAAKRKRCDEEEKKDNPDDCKWREDAKGDGGTINTFRKDKNDNRSPASAFNGNEQYKFDEGKRYDEEGDVAAWNDLVGVGLPTLRVPPADDFSIDDEATYWSNADLRVILRLNASDEVTAIEVHDNDEDINADEMTLATAALNSCSAIDGDPDFDLSPPYVSRIDIDPADNKEDYRYVPFAAYTEDWEDIWDSANEHRVSIPEEYSTDYTYLPKPIEWSKTFYDKREDEEMLFMEVDVRSLLNCITENSADFGFDIDDESSGGLVWYLSIRGDDSKKVNNYGIRVRNGATLAAPDSNTKAPDIAGLTIVSDQAIYIQGDYNAHESNTDDWRPASFLGDTINILSERFDEDFDPDSDEDKNADPDPNRAKGEGRQGGWDATIYWYHDNENDDNKDDPNPDDVDWRPEEYRGAGNGYREAAETEVRAAVLGGTDLTGGEDGTDGESKGKYNGGLENYPRFHEDWGGHDFVYAGSFVSLGLPRYKDGNWSIGTVYKAPGRVWSYEEAFNDAPNLPPLSPRATILEQGSFTRSYLER